MPTEPRYAEIRASVKLDGRVTERLLEQLVEKIERDRLLPRCNGFVVGFREPYAWLAFQTTDVHLERHIESYASGLLAGWITARADVELR